MKIAIDVTMMAEPGSGTWCYTANLVKHLTRVDRDNDYTLYGLFFRHRRRRIARMTLPAQPNVHFRPLRCPSRFSEQLLPVLPSWGSLMRGCDILHMPGYTILPEVRARIVVTIHGLPTVLFPDAYPPHTVRAIASFLNWAREKADAVIAVSASTAGELVRHAGFSRDRITVIHEAAADEFRVLKDRSGFDGVLSRFGIQGPYILSVGVLSPIKNLSASLQAFHGYLQNHPGSPHSYVIAGRPGWMYQDIFDTVKRLGLEKRVLFGPASHEELPILYNAADAFLFPSLYEGFGLPVLEAMRCGVPVITSNCAALPEVAGHAAMLVNPSSADEITGSLERLLGDPTLRNRMVEKGLRHSTRFTWEKAARETLTLYQSLAPENR